MAESNSTICVSLDEEEVVVGAQAMEEHDVFECNICMDPPTNSVLTKCGHMFCWSCLYQWLQNNKKPCPVCKLKVGSDDITPIYGCQRGSSSKSSDALTPPHPSVPSKLRQAMRSGERVGTTDVSIASNSTTPSDHGFTDATLEAYEAFQAQEYFQALEASRQAYEVSRQAYEAFEAFEASRQASEALEASIRSAQR